jgi:hypothetical protein
MTRAADIRATSREIDGATGDAAASDRAVDSGAAAGPAPTTAVATRSASSS